jgi:uncharacterized membrane protein
VNAPRPQAYRWVAATLRWGSYLSAALLLVGVVWLLAEGDGDRPIQIGPPMPLERLGEELLRGNPYAVMQTGVLLLLLTPLLRLVVAAASFWVEKERRYTLVSLAVLLMILLSVFLARLH